MDLIDLIPDLDEVATAEKVKKFFDKDLERLLRLADKQRSFFRRPHTSFSSKSGALFVSGHTFCKTCPSLLRTV